MLDVTYVRPDRVRSTSVLEPTAEHYQPVREAQAVAQQFTRIFGPTVWNYQGAASVPGLAAAGLVSSRMGTAAPGAIPVAHGYAPRFNRPQQAAQQILSNIPGAQPPSAYMPICTAAHRVAFNAATNAAMLAARLTPGPQVVSVRAQANAMNAFRRIGRYY